MLLSLFHEFTTKRKVFIAVTHLPFSGDFWKMAIASQNFLYHCQRQEWKCGENEKKISHHRHGLLPTPDPLFQVVRFAFMNILFR